METRTAAAILSALAHETRLEIFRLLVKAGPGGLAAGEIAENLKLPAPTLSFHLKELLLAEALHRERQGRSLIYRANYGRMNALVGFLTEECCRGVATNS